MCICVFRTLLEGSELISASAVQPDFRGAKVKVHTDLVMLSYDLCMHQQYLSRSQRHFMFSYKHLSKICEDSVVTLGGNYIRSEIYMNGS